MLARSASRWAALAALLILIQIPPVMSANIMVSDVLRRLGLAIPALNLIWILGGLPLTALTVLWAVFSKRTRPALPGLLLFVLGSAVEVVMKHAVPLPHPHAVPEPAILSAGERLFNIGPQVALSWFHAAVPSLHRQSANALLQGTFPSGHEFRLTYAVGLCFPHRRTLFWITAAVTALAVTATGGHWLGDAVGAGVLADACLIMAIPRTAPQPKTKN